MFLYFNLLWSSKFHSDYLFTITSSLCFQTLPLVVRQSTILRWPQPPLLLIQICFHTLGYCHEALGAFTRWTRERGCYWPPRVTIETEGWMTGGNPIDGIRSRSTLTGIPQLKSHRLLVGIVRGVRHSSTFFLCPIVISPRGLCLDNRLC